MKNLYFYISVFQDDEGGEAALNRGFVWHESAEQLKEEVIQFACHAYGGEPEQVVALLYGVHLGSVFHALARRWPAVVDFNLYGVVCLERYSAVNYNITPTVLTAATEEDAAEIYRQALLAENPAFNTETAEFAVMTYPWQDFFYYLGEQ